jgi:hypothetical protein
METIRFSDCVPLPAGFYRCPRREQVFIVPIMGINGISHYSAESWIRAMDLHPLEALLDGLLPEHGYLVDDGAGHRRTFVNCLGLRHIYNCYLLLVALEDVEFNDAAPAG